jgi:hypothetical protein
LQKRRPEVSAEINVLGFRRRNLGKSYSSTIQIHQTILRTARLQGIKPHAVLTPDKSSLTPARSSAKWMAAKGFQQLCKVKTLAAGTRLSTWPYAKSPQAIQDG